jgi:hypothetical protein
VELKKQYGEDVDCVIGCGFGKNGQLETVSLDIEPHEEENVVVFESEYCGSPCFIK